MTSTARIARKNARITFQRCTVESDRYRNQIQTWADYFTCSAYANTYAAYEDGKTVTYENRSVTFETRYCPELSTVNSTEYRILFNGEQYDILSVDAMNYQKDSLRFTCQRPKRQEEV